MKVREVLTWTVGILSCIHSVGNTVAQTDAHHVARDGRYVVSGDDGAQTVLSAAAVAVAAAAAAVVVVVVAVVAVVVVRVVRVVLGVPWLPARIPSVLFLRPVRL